MWDGVLILVCLAISSHALNEAPTSISSSTPEPCSTKRCKPAESYEMSDEEEDDISPENSVPPNVQKPHPVVRVYPTMLPKPDTSYEMGDEDENDDPISSVSNPANSSSNREMPQWLQKDESTTSTSRVASANALKRVNPSKEFKVISSKVWRGSDPGMPANRKSLGDHNQRPLPFVTAERPFVFRRILRRVQLNPVTGEVIRYLSDGEVLEEWTGAAGDIEGAAKPAPTKITPTTAPNKMKSRVPLKLLGKFAAKMKKASTEF